MANTGCRSGSCATINVESSSPTTIGCGFLAHYFESLGKVQTIYKNIFGRAIFLLGHNEAENNDSHVAPAYAISCTSQSCKRRYLRYRAR